MPRIQDLKESYDRYLEQLRKLEFIDCAIFTNLKYDYVDNEVDLYTNPPLEEFAADLLYISKDRRAVLLIEETQDPSDKKEQLKKYARVSSNWAKSLTRTDQVPAIDVMLVVPEDMRTIALAVYDEFIKEEGKLGSNRGISIWTQVKREKGLRLREGTLSPLFPKIDFLYSRGIGTLEILKHPHPLALLDFIIFKFCASGYGDETEGIELSKEKLSKLLTKYGIVNEGLWRTALRIGQENGYINNFSSTQLTGILNYTKPHPGSIARLGVKLAYPFASEKEQELKEGQAQLSRFDSVFEEP